MKKVKIKDYWVVHVYCDICGKAMTLRYMYNGQLSNLLTYVCENKHKISVMLVDNSEQ